MQTNQPNTQENQMFSSQGARTKELLHGSERSSTETGDRNRKHDSYNRSSANNRRTNYDSRAGSPTPRSKNRSQDWSQERRAEQSKTAESFEREKCRAVSEILHLRNARIVLNVGFQIFSTEIARIQTSTS